MSISLRFGAAAAALALLINPEAAQPEIPTLPEFIFKEDEHRSAAYNLSVDLQELTRQMSLPQGGDLTLAVMNIQNLLIAYNATSSEPANTPILEADGIFGPATARAIIDYAIREKDYNIIFENRFAVRDTNVLRAQLQELAPQEYIAAQNFINNEIISGLITKDFLECAIAMQTVFPSNEKLEEEISVLETNPGMISSVIPYHCQSDLTRLPALTRQDVQIKYLSSLFGRLPPEIDEWCARWERNTYNAGCIEINI